MGASKTIKKILIDKNITITKLAELMDKPRPTVSNTLFNDNLRVSTFLYYLDQLDCELIVRDIDNGREYKVYP